MNNRIILLSIVLLAVGFFVASMTWKGEVREEVVDIYPNGNKKFCELYRAGWFTENFIGERMYYEHGKLRSQCIKTGSNMQSDAKCVKLSYSGTIVCEKVYKNGYSNDIGTKLKSPCIAMSFEEKCY